jgi:hypothetical protein
VATTGVFDWGVAVDCDDDATGTAGDVARGAHAEAGSTVRR